jgi:hypothetical protein
MLNTEVGLDMEVGAVPNAGAKGRPRPGRIRRDTSRIEATWRPCVKFLLLIGLLLALTGSAFADPTDSTEVGVAEVRTLGTLNGLALACRHYSASSEAKALMIRYAPKTRRYGTLFEMATNTAFVAAAKDGASCPSESDLAARLAESAAALQAVFPHQPEPQPSEPAQPEPIRSAGEGAS